MRSFFRLGFPVVRPRGGDLHVSGFGGGLSGAAVWEVGRGGK